LDPIPEPDSYEKLLRSTQCQDQNWYEKLEEVPHGRTKTGMKSLKKYPMAGPDWYEKFEEVPNGRTRLVRIFFW
jgi:hypothetical protein